LVEILRGAIFRLAFIRRVPVAREQTDDRLTTSVGPPQCISPSHSRPQAFDIEEDIVGQAGVLGSQPLFERDGFPQIFARMAEKYPGHRIPLRIALLERIHRNGLTSANWGIVDRVTVC